MARFIHRHIRLTGMLTVILCVITCATLAARAANQVIATRYLGESAESNLPDLRAIPTRTSKAPPRPTKSGEQLVERNIFCADCGPVVIPGPRETQTEGGIPATTLPLELLATSLASDPDSSFATIRNNQSSQQGAFFAGKTIPGAGPIEKIAGTYVLFHNQASDRVEKISLLGSPAPAKPVATATPAAAASRATSQYADSVRDLGNNTYEVERDVVQKLISNPMQLGVRAMPAQKDGEMIGVRLYGIRANSPLAAIGLKSGDTLHSVNGHSLNSPDNILGAYGKLENAENFSLSLTRRGQPVEMKYQLR